ncbi:MAG: S46 family peptidase [Bacteroidales bacterium]|nr:S46 family peptidase [Bacteroidales bacterium]
MKKFSALIIAIALVFNFTAKADEGMWLLPLLEKLNIGTMTEMGLELTAEDIYSVNHSSLKDAIAIFGGGCTSEIVSAQGLVLTNHHCGYGSIQSHSTVEHNYLRDGFWAMSLDEELPNPRLGVTFLDYLEDVTDRVLADVTDDMTETERSKAISSAARKIQGEVKTDNFHFARIQPFFAGNKYYLMVYTQYRDVRFVGAPPSAIGKFGADTDNWMWPRHTGDFSMFRVYMSPDGEPANFSEDNIPYEPKHFLPISMKGVKEGDFAMILGYPGGTTRFMTSYEIDNVLSITHPNRIKIRGMRQDIMLEDMLADDAVRIKYASKYSGSTNYWKFSIGQKKGLQDLDVKSQKAALQEKFTNWISTDPAKQKKYGEALDLIKKSVEAAAPYNNAAQYYSECLTRGSEIIGFANRAAGLFRLLDENADAEMITKSAERLKASAAGYFKNYNAPTDHKITTAMLELFATDVPEEFHADIFNTIKKRYQGNYKKFVDKMFATSVFANEETLNAFLDKPNKKVLAKDLAYKAAVSIFTKAGEIQRDGRKYGAELARGQRLWIGGVVEMEKDKTFSPDANFTMRLTYGTVKSYDPKDAVHYKYYTTLKGVMEKEDPNNWEFVVPPKLKELYEAKDYGDYGDDGEMRVCFITNNDITGGNSGSGLINGRGELIGLAFDGNWEAMSGDIAFEPDLQRCIGVDIRYVLWIIDKYAGASHFIDEMTLVY